MRTLNRKLIRDLWQTRAQNLAIGLVVASGVAVFVMALGTLSFLQATRDAYYDRYRFADLFASLRRAPEHVAQRIDALPDVATVQTRIVSEVTLDVPGLEEPAVGRIHSIPANGIPKLNAIHVRRGRLPDADRSEEVLVSDAFFEANGLNIGDTLQAVLNGRLQSLQIVGVALSPEYVFQIRGGDLLPDNRRFGIFWMPRRQMEAAFDMDGAFNDLSVRLLRGAATEDVLQRMDDLLKPYGGVGAISRQRHVSARFLSDEIKQLRATALVSPTIFLGVAAFLLNIVLARRITAQREAIAILKAFGYTNTQITWHYLKSSLVIATVGGLVGSIAGIWMASGLARLYAEFYRFPTFVYWPDVRIVLLAIGIGLLAACIGSLRAIWGVVRLSPADAMRPAAPIVYHRSILEKWGPVRRLPITFRMIARNLTRRPINTLLLATGIGCSVAVLVLSGFGTDAIEHLIDFQFHRTQRQDIQVNFYQLTSPSARFELANMPGVQSVEPFRAVPAKLRFRHHHYQTAILGLPTERRLFRLLDTAERPIRLPPAGIVLGDKLAATLSVSLGDGITVETLEGQRAVRKLIVAGIATEFSGMNAYMQRSALNRLMRETDALSGAFLAVDSRFQDPLYHQLKQTPRVAAVSVKTATLDQFRKTIAENQATMQSFTYLFAAIIAVGVVYNTARLSLDERRRELATLRVIGFTRREVATIIIGELAVLTVMAIPIGWLMGYSFSAAMVKGFESELYRIPLIIRTESYARSALVVVIAAAASSLLARRWLNRLDLIEVLKSRQ